MENLPYGFSVTRDSFTHSIDKLIIYFYLNFTDLDSVFDSLVSVLESSSSWRCSFEGDRTAYKDVRPSSHYSWFRSSFWCDGLNVKIGEFSRHGLAWWLTSIVKVEFNPNKTFLRRDVGAVLEWLRNHCYSAILRECDYAVDLPCSTSSVITHSLKDKIIYNDSRYYGHRHSNGRLKVYNKRREVLDKEKRDIGSLCTRVEYTACFSGNIDFSCALLASSPSSDLSSLSSNLQSIVKLLLICSSYGEDPQELLLRLVPDKRNRDKLIPFVLGSPDLAIFDIGVFLTLLTWYSQLYGFNFFFHDSASSKDLGASVDITNSIVHIDWSGS